MPMDANGDYRSAIAQALAQYGQQPGALSMMGQMPTAPGAAQNPMLMGMMQRGPAAMPQGAMALGGRQR